MAKRIDGLTIAIKADTSGVTKSLQEVSGQSVNLSKNLKTVNSLLKLDPGNADLLAQKQKILADSIKVTTEKLDALKSVQNDVREQFERGEISTDQYLAFQNELVRTEKRLQSLKVESKDTDEEVRNLGKGSKDAGKNMEKAKEAASKLGNALKTGLVAGAKVAAAAVVAVGTATVAATKKMVDMANETADYGDNIDKMSQKLGISAQAYQEWDFILQHSGANIDSMQSSMKKLAESAVDGSKASIAAFEKLGISIDDARAMSEEDLFSTVITQLQEMGESTERTALASDLLGKSATELGALLNITADDTETMRQQAHDLNGVMSDEAVKASAQYKDSLQNLKTVVGGFARNFSGDMMPAIVQVMDGLTALFSGDDSGIGLISSGISEFSTTLGENIMSISEHAVEILPLIVEAITQNIPILLSAASEIMLSLVNGLVAALPSLVSSALVILDTLTKGILSSLPTILQVGLQIIAELALGIAEAIPDLMPTIVTVITDIVKMLTEPSTLVSLIEAAIAILVAIANGIVESLPILLEAMPVVIDNVVQALITATPMLITAAIEIIAVLTDGILNNLGTILSAAVQIVMSVIEGIVSMYAQTDKAIDDLMESIRETIQGYFSGAVTWGSDLIDNFVSGIKNGIGKVVDAAKNIAETVKSYIGFSEPELGPLSNFHTYAPDMMELFAKGIKENEDLIANQFTKSLSGIGVAAEISQAPQMAATTAMAPAVFNVSVNVGSVAGDYDVRRMTDTMVQEISSRLDLLKRQQTAATGGVYA